MTFGARAAALSGQASLLLGWRPAEFWSATPAELHAIVAEMTPTAQVQLGRDELSAMMALFPDGQSAGNAAAAMAAFER